MVAQVLLLNKLNFVTGSSTYWAQAQIKMLAQLGE